MKIKKTLKTYFSLTKPGVLFGNVITSVAGFLLASRNHFDLALFLAMLIGMTLVIASACVLNNYFDRDIDSIMERTKNRAIARGAIRGRNAVIFSLVLGILGMVILVIYTNLLTAGIALFGFVDYVWLYGMFSKRMSVHGTLVGSISGAIPILAGYTAVTNTIDMGAVLVFLVLFFWQLPEFYSIAIYRRDEYKAAGVPVVSVVNGVKNTQVQILFYTLALIISAALLSAFGYTGTIYLLVMLIIGGYWLWLAINGLSEHDVNQWARKMFRFSLIFLLVFSLMLSINMVLP